MFTELGLDPGASVFRVCVRGSTDITCEPALLVKRHEDGALLCGETAIKLIEHTNERVSYAYPFDRMFGKTSDHMLTLMRYAFNRADAPSPKRALLAVPFYEDSSMDAAYVEIMAQAGASECFLLRSPIAAHIGDGYTFDRARCILEIGAARANLCIVAGGKLVYGKTVRMGGNHFDAALVSHMSEYFGIRISSTVAERAKRQIGTLSTRTGRNACEVQGRLGNGERITHRLKSEDMIPAFEGPTSAILRELCTALDNLPADAIKDVLSDGIFLYGGGARLRGFDRLIAGVTGVKTILRAEDDQLVIKGIKMALDALPTQIRPLYGDVTARVLKLFSPAVTPAAVR